MNNVKGVSMRNFNFIVKIVIMVNGKKGRKIKKKYKV